MTTPTDVSVTVAELRKGARGNGVGPRIANTAADLFEQMESERKNQARALSEADSRYNTAVTSRKEWQQAAGYWMPRALAAEARLAEFKAEAITHISDLSHELSAEIEARYAGMLNYPSQKRKYDGDMDSVKAARTFLNAQEKA